MSTDDTDDPTAIDVRLAADLTVIRPGDTALVRMHRDTRREQLLFVAERLRDRMPGVDVLMLPGAEGVEVYRPQAASGADTESPTEAVAATHQPTLHQVVVTELGRVDQIKLTFWDYDEAATQLLAAIAERLHAEIGPRDCDCGGCDSCAQHALVDCLTTR
ncbi:hypothetical protein [Streptomyces sp. NPDC047070]|uniref:hypothetical protein n=1 Tax=Streptomyces sp. NPDC047070 TaxID=3154923 RepID=UPI003455C4ED